MTRQDHDPSGAETANSLRCGPEGQQSAGGLGPFDELCLTCSGWGAIGFPGEPCPDCSTPPQEPN